MARHVSALEAQLQEIKDHFTKLCTDPIVSDRIMAVIPALVALLEGRKPTAEQQLRRNVALHAKATGISVAGATTNLLRRAQHGPRLEPKPMSAKAPSFVPGVPWAVTGTWHVENTGSNARQAKEQSHGEVPQRQASVVTGRAFDDEEGLHPLNSERPKSLEHSSVDDSKEDSDSSASCYCFDELERKRQKSLAMDREKKNRLRQLSRQDSDPLTTTRNALLEARKSMEGLNWRF
jgi:hypothetical protein